MRFKFPFRRDNRRPDGFWDAPDADDDNIRGTSVDPYDPVWPRWKQAPPDHGEGEFISEGPFFDIDEIRQRAEFYPPGRPLVDKNFAGNPASRQRVGDVPSGNLSRRRLLVARTDDSEGWPPARMSPENDRPLVLAQAIPRNPDGTWRAPEATEENIKGTSVDRTNPVWPRWTDWPRREGESGNFISDEHYYLIDELTGKIDPIRRDGPSPTSIKGDSLCAVAGTMTPPRAIPGDSGSMFGAAGKSPALARPPLNDEAVP